MILPPSLPRSSSPSTPMHHRKLHSYSLHSMLCQKQSHPASAPCPVFPTKPPPPSTAMLGCYNRMHIPLVFADLLPLEKIQYARFNTLDSTRSIQHARFNTPHSTRSIQHARLNTLHSTRCLVPTSIPKHTHLRLYHIAANDFGHETAQCAPSTTRPHPQSAHI
jgi:hypothetical protein